jgi:hypothetical protein
MQTVRERELHARGEAVPVRIVSDESPSATEVVERRRHLPSIDVDAQRADIDGLLNPSL